MAETSIGAGLQGVFGQPYLSLDPCLDLAPLGEIHEEICLGLTQVPVDYTGGSHRAMGIMPASLAGEAHTDYGEVIRALSDAEFLTFRGLSDDPEAIDPAKRGEIEFGEERDQPLSRKQMLWLKYRFGVYFPWKVYVELIPNRYWSDKSQSEGKDFTRAARTFFPKTVAYVKRLPFASIGRCNIMGLEANDHGTVHRDGPGDQAEPDHFISLCPGGNKRLFLWDEAAQRRTMVTGRAYWFNDHDYHGVVADPFFRYSLRIDGVFRADFLEALRRDPRALHLRAPTGRP